MKVNRLPVEAGPAAWDCLLAPSEPSVALTAETSADYLIIGAGFAGVSAARRLSQLEPQSRIVVLEALGTGEGAVGRNSGFMIDLPHELSSADYSTELSNDRQQIALNRKAIEFARAACAEYGVPEDVFNACGKYNGAAGEPAHQHNLDYAKHLDELGEAYELLNAPQMQRLTGSSFYRSGLYTPGSVLLQPAAYVKEFVKGLRNKVSFFEKSPVIALNRSNGKWLAQTKKGSVKTSNVIVATNGHIESFGHFKRRVFHVILYASMTRDLSSDEHALTGKANWGITPSDPMATTMRKFTGRGGTRMITRNQMSYSPSMQIEESMLSEIAKRHQVSFAKRYPELAHVEQEYTWSGRLCLSRNSAPAFGQVEEGLFSACCQNGLGSTKGTLAGMAAAEFASQGETELVKAILEQGKPSRLPPAPLDRIGANALMRWGEFKARNEI